MVRTILIRIILGGTQILLVMLLIHTMSIILRVFLSSDLINLIHALGLGKFVDLAPGKSRKEFFREGVVDGFS